MRQIWIYIWGLLMLPMNMMGLTIPQGQLHFDNSLTQYPSVFFVYGSDAQATTYALSMTYDGHKWSVTIPATVSNMYRFTFVSGDLREGVYHRRFSDFKDSISHQLNRYRTATSEAQMAAGQIYVPSSADNWAQGQWMDLALWETTHSDPGQTGQAAVSGTLPVVYVNTDGHRAVTDKETQIPASIYIDSVLAKYPSLGSAAAPIRGTIKGRGNYTWNDFDKKPYKLKFDTKQPVLGMPNNRHWCLLANADDYLGFMKMVAGLRVSKAVGLRWTPRMRPVELVLNDQYMGLYFLTEHVRIASNRVHIHEQADGETHPDSITGGWLVEIDNYASEGNISFNEGNGQYMMISLREPDSLSYAQRTYLESQLYAINDALYGSDETALRRLLDLDEAAKYYIVQEIMEDCESYHGSCFLYKDRDSMDVADPWKFGPVWDFGNAYNRYQERWIYDGPQFEQYWIGQLAQWDAFQEAIQEPWWIFYHTQQDSVRTKISQVAASIAQAAKNDAARWGGTRNYQDNSNMSAKLNDFLTRFNWRIAWLYNQWGEGQQPATWGLDTALPTSHRSHKILINGQLLIRLGDTLYDLMGRPVQ